MPGAVLAGSIAAAFLAQTASASVLYDNGPINGNLAGWTINDGQAIGDSFTLSTAAIVGGVTFGVLSDPGDTVSQIDWGITDVYGAVVVDGTAAVTSGAATPGLGGLDVRTDSFTIGALSLGAGTYYLWLQNAASGDLVYWDVNGGPSSAYYATSGVFVGEVPHYGGGTGSNTFQILSGTAVPEPAGWVLMALGFGGLGAGLRARRRTAAATA